MTQKNYINEKSRPEAVGAAHLSAQTFVLLKFKFDLKGLALIIGYDGTSVNGSLYLVTGLAAFEGFKHCIGIIACRLSRL